MKRFSARQTLLLCLPLLFVAGAGIMVSNSRARERAFYAQPFVPGLKVVRGKVPGDSLPGLFEVEAHCLAVGGQGQSHWLLRGQLFDMSGKAPREIWNSQKLLTPELVEDVMSGAGGVSLDVANNPSRPSNDGSLVLHLQVNRCLLAHPLALPASRGRCPASLSSRLHLLRVQELALDAPLRH